MRIWHVCLVYRGCLSYNCHKNVDELTRKSPNIVIELLLFCTNINTVCTMWNGDTDV